MIRIPVASLAAVLLVAPIAGVAYGQMTPHYLVAAGVALPTGTFSDGNDAGYHLGAGVELKSADTPLGIRIEGTYTEFNNSGVGGKSIVDGGSANLVYTLSGAATGRSAATAMTLYGIGGVGYYGTREPEFFSTPFNGEVQTFSQTNVGWNLGGGLRFPLSGFDAYVEARYVSVNSTDVRFVPITFGLVF